MPVIDTNLLIRIDHGDPAAKSALVSLASEDLVVPAQVAAEYLVRAAEPPSDFERLRRAFRIVHTTDAHVQAAALLAARVFGDGKGARVRWADIHIAAAAILEETYVVTTNKRDFARLGVPAWNYVEEQRPSEGP